MRRFSLLSLTSLVMSMPASAVSLISKPEIHYGSDKRITARTSLGSKVIQGFVHNKSKKSFDIHDKNLQLIEVKKSLTATHYYYQQLIDGVELENARLIVSVDNESNEIIRTYDSLIQPSVNKTSKGAIKIQKEKAPEITWKHLQVKGKILSEPKAELKYIQDDNGEVKLTYRVYLDVEIPRGSWVQYVDVVTGKVIKTTDIRDILHKEKISQEQLKREESLPLLNFQQELQRFYEKKSKNKSIKEGIAPINQDGKALVFVPDPLTFLGDPNLLDDSSPEAFDAAYQQVTLKDLTVVDGIYTLKGPWVHIVDFESPVNPPSTSKTGEWTAKRGENAFNDVMTYFHIDQNQRYIQSLGFSGETGIQQGPITVDTDGRNGDDNSFYNVEGNILSFGHGCVDDNEDADVILHEYSHAISRHINTDFYGGDTGAMGEGFGDYWAGSYSLSLQNAGSDKNKVFNWDGIASCWRGRRLDKLNYKYDHFREYKAHGYESDELWSTPIFQSLLEAVELGIRREEIDQIILEAQFGLGANLKMRDMANSIVDTAKRLFPQGEHADIFTKHFKHHKIFSPPEPKIEFEGFLNDKPYLLPGETFESPVLLKNRGDGSANAVNFAFTSSSSRILLHQNQVSINDIGAKSSKSSTENIKYTIANNTPCGSLLAVDLTLKGDGVDPFYGVIKKGLQIGRPVPISFNQFEVNPDNDEAEVSSVISINNAMKISRNFKVGVIVEHNNPRDLIVKVISPNGFIMYLELMGMNRELTMALFESDVYTDLIDEPIHGDWVLKIKDEEKNNSGKLVQWEIRDVERFDCTANK